VPIAKGQATSQVVNAADVVDLAADLHNKLTY